MWECLRFRAVSVYWGLCLTVVGELVGVHLADEVEVLLYLRLGVVDVNLEATLEEFGCGGGVLEEEVGHDAVCGHVVEVTCEEVEKFLVVT